MGLAMASATPPTSRRAPSMRALVGKRQKVTHQIQQIHQAEKQGALMTDMLAIITELTTHPHKIANAKIAIMSDMFDDAKETTQEKFVHTYIYLPKVPKEWLIANTIPAMSNSKLTEPILKQLCKADRRVDQKILYYATATTPAQKIVNHTRTKFDEAMVARTMRLGNPLDSLAWEPESMVVDWSRTGVFKLVPPWDGSADKKDWVHTHIECVYLQGDAAKAAWKRSAHIRAHTHTHHVKTHMLLSDSVCSP
jgi:hypothetical protein